MRVIFACESNGFGPVSKLTTIANLLSGIERIFVGDAGAYEYARQTSSAVKHIDLARLQRGEAVLRGERDIAHLARIAEHAGGERAAIVDIESLEIALRNPARKIRQSRSRRRIPACRAA